MPTPEQTIAEEAARAGGAIAARYFREGVAMRNKDVANLVSDADVEAEHAIAAVIKRAFPSHAILGEEAYQGDATAEHLWIVDPIDGTNNFAHKIPHFAVSVAYYHAGEAQCGVVYNPVREEWHTAAKGQGAFHDGRQVSVDEAARLDEVLVGVGFYYDRGAMMESTLAAIGDLKRLGRSTASAGWARRRSTSAWSAWAASAPSSNTSSPPGTSPPAGCSSRRPAAVSPTPAAAPCRWESRASWPRTARSTRRCSKSSAPRHPGAARAAFTGPDQYRGGASPTLEAPVAPARFPRPTGKIGGRTEPRPHP